MRRRGTGAALLLCLVLSAVFWPPRTADAASVTITFTTEREFVHVGEEVEVTLLLASDATMGGFEAYLSYDDTVLEFSAAPACIIGGGGRLRVSDLGASASAGERTYKIRFTAVAAGDCEISVYDRPKVYGYSDGAEMSVTSVSSTIAVLPAVNASDNSALASLRLAGEEAKEITLIPEFSGTETSYFAMVGYGTRRVMVSAIPEDGRATVALSGEQDLSVGSNAVTVTVTAENGTQTVYTVYVSRLEEEVQPTPVPEPTGAPEGEEPPEDGVPQGVHFSPSEDGVLLTTGHAYLVCDTPEGFALPKGYGKTYLLVDGIQATAYTKEDDAEEEFLLLLLQREDGSVGWYRYDRIDQTVQRVAEEQFVIETVIRSDDEELKRTIAQYESKERGQLLALAFLSAVCVFLVLLVLVLALVLHRRKRAGKRSEEAAQDAWTTGK